MCGRFSLFSDSQKISDYFKLANSIDLSPRYNISPGSQILAVTEHGNKSHQAHNFHWGLIPSWARDEKMAFRMINARAETVEKKPAFKRAFKTRRCLVIMDGFFEWKEKSGTKQPYYIHKSDKSLLGVAGLWEYWKRPDGQIIKSCTIITTVANTKMALIHDRMPVILTANNFEAWLDIDYFCQDELKRLLKPYSGDDLSYYPVSQKVNNARFQSQEAIWPI